ncbi:MAG TPA: alpha/beta fold hydrolase [Solirubrobacteraceae bacterium]|nr:alpha/beta fold hydrolase [Solirubrobacteraceae bacterium]
MTVIGAGEVELDYERAGAGEPLLMIMGMSGTYLHWHPAFLAGLQQNLETIVHDHRGVGASTRLEGPVTIAQLAVDAAALLDALGIESAHVLGISMGGMVAQELVLARPGLVKTLTIGCSYCGGPDATLGDPGALSELTAAMIAGDRERALRAGWELNTAPPLRDDSDAYAEFCDIATRRSVAAGVVMAQMQACAAHDTHDRLAAVAAPTLVIHGTEDRLLPYPNGELIASLIPGAKLETMTDRAHLFFWEEPARSAALVTALATG